MVATQRLTSRNANDPLDGLVRRELRADEVVSPYALPRFPLVIEPQTPVKSGDAFALFERNRTALRAELTGKGALLFRGFGVGTPDAFQTALLTLGLSLSSSYDFGMTRRSWIAGSVFTSTDYNRHLMIPPHTEMSYMAVRPSWVSFCCQHPPRAGSGETPIFDLGGVCSSLPQDLKQRLSGADIRYLRRIPLRNRLLPGSRTISETFGTEDPRAIANMADERGVQIEWLESNLVLMQTVVPSVVIHPVTGISCLTTIPTDMASQRILFRHFADRSSRLEHAIVALLFALLGRSSIREHQMFLVDDQELSSRELEQIYETLFDNMAVFEWRADDVLLLDNIRAGHGRLAYSGAREILACFGDPYDAREAQRP